MKTRKRLFKSAILLALLCLSSCAQTDTDGTADTSLPAGKYPMAFTTSVNELSATRATTDNTWDGGEEIALQIGDEVKKYVINVSGDKVTLTSDDPFYWTSRTETIRGWYYGDGNYVNELREEWEVQWDQYIEYDEFRGYQWSDFLYAPAQEVSFGKDTPLNFYHQTARVVINIINADAATDANQIRNLLLGATGELYIGGEYTAPTQGGATVGTWDITSSYNDYIKPKDITTPGSRYLKTYTALVIPQDMTDKEFFTIWLDDGYVYHYIPKAGEANLEGGKQYTYDVTVKIGYLEVEMREESGKWNSSGDAVKVESETFMKGFSSADLKIGDFYYSDGTTSDGGYRKYPDGKDDFLNVDPVLTNVEGKERKVVGIVLYAGHHPDDTSDYSNTGIGQQKCHGYVMALMDVNKDEDGLRLKWYGREEVLATYPKVGASTDTSDWNGYSNTKAIQTYVENNASMTMSDFPAANSCINFSMNDYAAPVKSSGWFLPSAGQLKYISDYQSVLSSRISTLSTILDNSDIKWLSNKSGYWSSSEDGATVYNGWNVSIEDSSVNCLSKDNSSNVRTVCAF